MFCELYEQPELDFLDGEVFYQPAKEIETILEKKYGKKIESVKVGDLVLCHYKFDLVHGRVIKIQEYTVVLKLELPDGSPMMTEDDVYLGELNGEVIEGKKQIGTWNYWKMITPLREKK